jgi:hypothetical protein
MRVARTSSWRLEVTGGGLFELALFVRDAAGLDTAQHGDDFPSLIGSVPDVSGVLDPVVRRAALCSAAAVAGSVSAQVLLRDACESRPTPSA